MAWNIRIELCWCILVSWIFVVDALKLNQQSINKPLKVHHYMTRREIRTYFGVDTHEKVPEYDVTSPFQADESGNFLSYKLHEHARRKRDASHDEPNLWYYQVQAFGVSLHLNLTKNNNLLAPGLVVEKINKNGSKEYSEPPHSAFYAGHVTSDPNSVVAIGNHDGLKGIINHFGSSFFMQPLPSRLARYHGVSSGSQPHLIFRRSLDNEESRFGVIETQLKRSSLLKKETSRSFSSSRKSRSVPDKHLEVLLAADHLYLNKFHSDKEATDLLLTLANILNAMYHDESIGDIKVTVSVVKIVLLHHGLSYTSKATSGQRLSSMEVWIGGNMPESDADKEHGDQVLLVSGQGFGGLAQSGSTCKGYGASVSNGDLGLATALIMAHESAHALGVGHDGNKEAGCPDNTFIMSTTTAGGKNAFRWSPCSSTTVQSFLSGSSSSCLNDHPLKDVSGSRANHNKLPGQVYDSDAQCALQFGASYKLCPRMRSSCGSLYCTKDGGASCVSSVVPQADGSKCGERQWCIKGECVDDGSPMIDGGWSQWSSYAECSYSCGGGAHYRTRNCTNPPPKNGGMDCEGESVGHWRICNPEACPEGTPTHREAQCTAKWSGSYPYKLPDRHPCQLVCKYGAKVRPYETVKDGTRCSLDRKIKDVCIGGKCKSVGCDNILESGVKYDRCKVCNGDSTTCKMVYGKVLTPCKGSCTVLDVPIGATNITVNEEVEDWNFLGVKDDSGKDIYPVTRTWSISKHAAGTIVYYYHEKYEDADRVFIPGPTDEHLQVYYKQYVARQPVDYSLNEPAGDEHLKPGAANWVKGEWSVCTHSCAGGIQIRTVECILQTDATYLNDAVCEKTTPKPAKQQDCNTQSCPPTWYVSGWRPCSKTCGKGAQTREVVCRQEVTRGKFQTLSDSKCTGNKPSDPVSRDCNKIDCPAENVPGDWSACSTSCGAGIKTRKKSCQRLKETGVFEPVPEVMCSAATVPPLQEGCNQDVKCPGDRLYEPLGCFRDGNPRALPQLIKNLRKGINWGDMSETVAKCAKATAETDPSLKVFGLQFYGECFSGTNGLKTYDKYGALPYGKDKTEHCWEGVGSAGINFVYKFVD